MKLFSKKEKICFRQLFFILLLLLFYSVPQFAQTPTFLKEDNEAIRSKVEMVDDAGWIFFSPNSIVRPNELFTSMKKDFGLGVNDAMVLTKNWSDKYEYSHNRYQQYHKGLRVEGAEFTTHYQNNKIEIAHGKLVENLQINHTPNITETEALNLAMTELGADEYAWQNEEWEEALKADLADGNATYLPKGDLYLVRINGDQFLPNNFKVAWEFEIRAISPAMLKIVAIDANTGTVLRIREVAKNNGPAVTMYNGTQTIDTEWRGWPKNYHRLKTDDNNRAIHTKVGTSANANFYWSANVKDKDDDWPSAKQEATSAHWAVTQAWDYFKDVHGRSGIDNNNRSIRVWAGSDLNNATFRLTNDNSDYFEFGTLLDDNGLPISTNLATLDIAGHEYAHGVTAHTAGLDGEREPGALDESFSDIFGFLVERHGNNGVVNDWLIGEDAIPLGAISPTVAGLRSLNNPGAFNDPTTFLGLNWVPTNVTNCLDGDGCGIHSNSSVQNFWFHLLSMGGQHNSATINGIGIDEAAEIVYLNLTAFMQNASQYADARLGAIAAARIIFGRCSFEEIETTNAWAACGVGGVFDMNCSTIQGPRIVCIRGEEAPYSISETIIVNSTPGITFTWNHHSTLNTTISGIGNNTLTIHSINTLPPPPSFPYTYTITATSSTGVILTHQVNLEDCRRRRRKLNASTSSITIRPNPVNDFLVIDAVFTGKKRISIFDTNGRLVLSKESNDKKISLNVEDLAKGVYFLKIETKKESYTSKFIK